VNAAFWWGGLKEREYVEEKGVDRNDNCNIDLKE
jgi:hypothetical protein